MVTDLILPAVESGPSLNYFVEMSKQTTPTSRKTTIMAKYLSSLQKSKRLRAPEKKIVVPRLFCVENDIDFLIMISNYKFTRQKMVDKTTQIYKASDRSALKSRRRQAVYKNYKNCKE